MPLPSHMNLRKLNCLTFSCFFVRQGNIYFLVSLVKDSYMEDAMWKKEAYGMGGDD